jgi:putative PIN family toxin of toxin-antitoxin system
LTVDIARDIIKSMRSYVLDTDTVVAAFRSSEGASRQMLVGALTRRFQLVLSVPLLLEYEAVLKRAEHLSASGASNLEVEEILDALASVGLQVKSSSGRNLELPDPNDKMVLEAAINGWADAIVTFNVRHFVRASRRYGVRVILPGQALREIGGSRHEKK